jgi:hypothetical protein
MANFQTHLNGGIFTSGAAVLALHEVGLVEPGATFGYFALGVAGSLLPDIDADASKPVRAFFNVLGVAAGFFIALPMIGKLLPMELVLIWVGVYLCVRYLVFELFNRLTVHRGIWHSWLGIGVATLATVNIAFWGLQRSPESAWVAGLMVGIGYLTHLCLDELYSVDLLNSRVKRSFGTALKPFSLGDLRSSFGMLAVVLVLGWLAPRLDWHLLLADAPERTTAGTMEGMSSLLDEAARWAALFRALVDWFASSSIALGSAGVESMVFGLIIEVTQR